MFLTSKVSNLLSLAILGNCTFTSNSAQSNGGALYSVNQRLDVKLCTFKKNIVGQVTSLFGDSAVAGGALWYSSQEAHSTISDSHFEGQCGSRSASGYLFLFLFYFILL